MGVVDFALLVLYGMSLIAVAVCVSRKRVSTEEYYLGSKNLGPTHIGLSVAATDVGGGFSIGLGALGFGMGLAGSWLLFTGLVGALLSSVLLIPRLKKLELDHPYFSYPQVMRHFYGKRAGHLAALISFVGYLGFTAAQLMAGTKLAHTLIPEIAFSWMLFLLAAVAVIYTSIGGLRAVVYTDTIQWIMVVLGLSLIAIPCAVVKLGGLAEIREVLPASRFSLAEIAPQMFLNWMVAIVPIWFVAMTLYQRIFACRDEREAKRAWLVAGLFEWPVMAFVGVTMGLLASAALAKGLIASESSAVTLDDELAIPLLLKHVLPPGLLGLVFAAYLSAVLSTADSCLMAASGNFYSDFLQEKLAAHKDSSFWKSVARVLGPKGSTFSLGIVAFLIASQFESVLKLMLYAYGFMISGLFVPTLAAFFWNGVSSGSAITSMIGGAATYLICEQLDTGGWNANFFGIPASLVSLLLAEMILRARSTSS